MHGASIAAGVRARSRFELFNLASGAADHLVSNPKAATDAYHRSI